MKVLSGYRLSGFLLFMIVLISFSAIGNAKRPSTIPPLPAVAQNDPFFGIVQAIHDPDKAVQAGVRWERLVVWWSNFQPNGPDEWVSDAWFARNLIDYQKGRNIEPVGVILHTPLWAAKDEGYRHISPPKNLELPFDHPENYWGQFVSRLASEYAGTVDTWILGNEPDIYRESYANWAGSIEEFARMQVVGYQAIKKANPNAKVVLTGTTYWWDVTHERTLYIERLITQLQKMPGASLNGNYFDAVAVHQYSNPLNSYTVPVIYRRILQKHGLNKPLWLVESNVVPHDDPIAPLHRGGLRASMEEQANYMIQSVALARAAGIERYAIYKMRDESAENGQYYGLVRNDGTPRPAYVAYQTAVRELSNVTNATYFWNNAASPPTEDEITALLATTTEYAQFVWPGALNGVRMQRGADRVTVLWNATAAPLKVGIPSSIKQAKVVNKYGQEQWIERQADGAFHLTLAAATNNTESQNPELILVGGDPIILVEPRAAAMRNGLPRLLDDACWGVPGASVAPHLQAREGWMAPTGYVVSGPWLDFYHGRGGVDNIGYPRSPLIQDPMDEEKCVQYYQNLILEWHPDNKPDDRIQRRLLTRELTGLAPAPPSKPEQKNDDNYWYFDEGTTGLGHPVTNLQETQIHHQDPDSTIRVYIGFKDYFDNNGKEAAFGYPMESPIEHIGADGSKWWSQRFQAAIFEYHPDLALTKLEAGGIYPWQPDKFRLKFLGDEYILHHNLPFMIDDPTKVIPKPPQPTPRW